MSSRTINGNIHFRTLRFLFENRYCYNTKNQDECLYSVKDYRVQNSEGSFKYNLSYHNEMCGHIKILFWSSNTLIKQIQKYIKMSFLFNVFLLWQITIILIDWLLFSINWDVFQKKSWLEIAYKQTKSSRSKGSSGMSQFTEI